MGTIIVFVKNMRGQRWGMEPKKYFTPKNQLDGNLFKAYHEKLMSHLEEILPLTSPPPIVF